MILLYGQSEEYCVSLKEDVVTNIDKRMLFEHVEQMNEGKIVIEAMKDVFMAL